MKNQRFIIVPAFCFKTKKQGFKFVDTEKELGETSIFFTMQTSLQTFTEFVRLSKERNDSLEFIFDVLLRSFFETLADEIIFLPLPVVSLSNEDVLEIAKRGRGFYDEFLKFKEIYTSFVEWGKRSSFKKVLIFITKYSSSSTSRLQILIPVKDLNIKTFFLEAFEPVKSKQQARLLLKKSFDDNRISEDDYVSCLSEINLLEDNIIPEQTPEEKLADLSKQN